MIAMIFEFWMTSDDDDAAEYLATSTGLRGALGRMDGFGGVERFESCTEPGKFLAIGFFDDEAAVERWRNEPTHRRAQTLGRNRFFNDYRLRMADVVRDYGSTERYGAPADSNSYHEGSRSSVRR